MGMVYTQLSLHEGRRIEDLWLAKVPVAEMARVLKHLKSIFLSKEQNFFESFGLGALASARD